MAGPEKSSADQESFKDVILGADGVYRVAEAAEPPPPPRSAAAEGGPEPGPSSAPHHDAPPAQAPTQAGPSMTDSPPRPSRSRNFSNVALLSLVALLAGAGLALWLAPKVAPHMPAPVARLLAPDAPGKAELAEVWRRMEGYGADLNRLGAAAGSVGGLEARLDSMAADLDKLRAVPAAPDPAPRLAAFDERVGALEKAVAALAAQNQAAEAPAGADGGRVAALEERVAALTQALAARPEGAPAPAGVDPAVLDAVSGLSKRLSALEAKPAPEGGAVPADLAARVDTLEAQVAELGHSDLSAALTVAAADLQAAMIGSAPFTAQLENFESLSGLSADEALRIYARTGLTTLPTLAASFDEAARAAVSAEERERARAAEDLGGKLGAAVSSLVTVRRAAESGGVDTPSILARARARLAEDDLASAMAELQALSSVPRAAMEDWLAKAQARLNAEDAFAKLRRRLTAQ